MDRYKSTKKASVLGILGNIFLLIIKAIVGFISNSQSMIADAFNSFGDVFSSFMTYIGNRISSKEPDEDHNLGHGKAEYIYSLFISIIMTISSIYIFKDSLETIINKHTYTYSGWLIIICIITIVVKLSLFIYSNTLAKKYHNILLKASSKDHLIDSVITTINLISCIFAKYNIYALDGYIGIMVAIWIIYTSIKIFKESYDILMDKCISNETKQKVLEIIDKYPEVKRVNHFNSTPIGYRYQISFTIFVDGNLRTYESHAIADKLEREITKTFDDIYLTVIHVHPIDISSNK